MTERGRPRWMGGVVALGLSLALACQGGGGQAPAEAPPASLAFTVSVGMGGGFTGQYEGHRVRGDRAVVRWQSVPGSADPSEEVVGEAAAGDVARLEALTRSSRSLMAGESRPGNMSTVVEAHVDGADVRGSWPFGQEPADVKPLLAAFDRMLAASGATSQEGSGAPADGGEAGAEAGSIPAEEPAPPVEDLPLAEPAAGGVGGPDSLPSSDDVLKDPPPG